MAAFYRHTDVFIHEETKDYPITVSEISRRHVVAFGVTVPADLIAQLGYAVVRQTARPSGDVVSPIFPEKDEEGWKTAYEVREFTEEEKNSILAQLKADAESDRQYVQAEVLSKGAAFDFGGEHGVQHIQLRTIDRTNIAGITLMSIRKPELPQVFCTYENKIVPMTGEQIQDLADAALAGYTAIMQASWELREDIENATSKLLIPTRSAMLKKMSDAAELNVA